ncbi:TPA: DNA-processing protein DprA [Corynebacterium striatum]|nr:DNA-processing protein DprA [Corynebacterium striatum]
MPIISHLYLAQKGTTITSGGAIGVETVALEQSLEFEAPIVVFHPTGLDEPYPARNGNLYQHAARSPRGMLVTPYPMGTTPNRARFLYRNALAVALTRGALITEATACSGAINVTNYAHAAGERTMAIPGPVTAPGSTGCHTLIRDGKADLVLGAQEVIDALDSPPPGIATTLRAIPDTPSVGVEGLDVSGRRSWGEVYF